MHKLPKGGGTKIITYKPMHKLHKGLGTNLINIKDNA